MKDHLRIAVIGVFDLDNYGDHLFPIMIEHYLLLKGVSAEIVLYSIFQKDEGFKTGKHIYSVNNIEQDHLKNPFHAIIVAGGEIIHFGHYKHLLEGKEISYPIYGCFIAASMLSAKYGIPLAWNNPGIPFDFELQYQTIMKEVLKPVDYISVRNQKSADLLKKYDEKHRFCKISFDTAFIMSDIFPKEEFQKIKKRLPPPQQTRTADSYIVFHFNKMVSEENLSYIENTIRKLNSLGKYVILLPIAYTNGDREFLSRFAEKHSDICTCISDELSIKDFVAILGSCELYVGLSYHGAITALSYEKPVVAIDYFRQPKSIDLFHALDMDDFYLNSCENLYNVCSKALLQGTLTKNVEKAKKEVYKHFDRMFICLINTNTNKKLIFDIESMIKIISNISDKFQEMTKENAELQMLRDYTHSLKVEHERMVHSLSWRITKPLRLIKGVYIKIKIQVLKFLTS